MRDHFVGVCNMIAGLFRVSGGGYRDTKFAERRYLMTIEIALLISIVSVAFSIFFGIKNSKRTDTKDIEERVKENTRINVKLDNITQTTQEIKSEISSMRTEISSHNDRLIKLEESVKSAHHRIDGVVERLNGGNHNE